jgi:hypothetical protein
MSKSGFAEACRKSWPRPPDVLPVDPEMPTRSSAGRKSARLLRTSAAVSSVPFAAARCGVAGGSSCGGAGTAGSRRPKIRSTTRVRGFSGSGAVAVGTGATARATSVTARGCSFGGSAGRCTPMTGTRAFSSGPGPGRTAGVGAAWPFLPGAGTAVSAGRAARSATSAGRSLGRLSSEGWSGCPTTVGRASLGSI